MAQRRAYSAFTRTVALLAGALVLTVAVGCGSSGTSQQADPDTGFARALGDVGKGFEPTGTGFGWVDLSRTPNAGAVSGALGPGLGTLLAEPAELRSVGVDISNAKAATSIATSYGLALRIDRVAAGRLPRLLEQAGAKTERSGEWTNYDLGDEWAGQLKGPLEPLGDLVPRIAVGPNSVIFSRVASARDALLEAGDEDSPVADPANALAAGCLGEVTSARTFPGDFTHNPSVSPDLIAVGELPGPGKREILCAIGTDRSEVDSWEHALKKSFGSNAADPLSGKPISHSVKSASVKHVAGDGVQAARAELVLAPGEERGYLYGALVGGKILPFIGASRPVPEDSRVQLGR